jgi:hypothetical protein
MNREDTANILLWVEECRKANHNAITNTHTGKWLDIACGIIQTQYSRVQDTQNALVDAAFAKQELDLRYDKEVEEFNAGWECAKNGGAIDDEPAIGITEDQWRTGFMAGSYDQLQAENERMRRDLQQCTTDGQRLAKLLHECEAENERLREGLKQLLQGGIR